MVVVFGAKAIRPDLPPVGASLLQTGTNFAPSQVRRSKLLWLQPMSKPPPASLPVLALTNRISSP